MKVETAERGRIAGCERVSFRAVWEGGLDCLFYDPASERTMHLRDSLYVVVTAGGRRFAPSDLTEHFPRVALAKRQGELGGRGHGADEGVLEVGFVCFAPEGSGAAEEGRALILDALEEFGGLGDLSGWSRNAVAVRYRRRHDWAMLRGALRGTVRGAYRPPGEGGNR